MKTNKQTNLNASCSSLKSGMICGHTGPNSVTLKYILVKPIMVMLFMKYHDGDQKNAPHVSNFKLCQELPKLPCIIVAIGNFFTSTHNM